MPNEKHSAQFFVLPKCWNTKNDVASPKDISVKYSWFLATSLLPVCIPFQLIFIALASE